MTFPLPWRSQPPNAPVPPPSTPTATNVPIAAVKDLAAASLGAAGYGAWGTGATLTLDMAKRHVPPTPPIRSRYLAATPRSGWLPLYLTAYHVGRPRPAEPLSPPCPCLRSHKLRYMARPSPPPTPPTCRRAMGARHTTPTGHRASGPP